MVCSTIVCPYFKDFEALYVVRGMNSVNRPGHQYREIWWPRALVEKARTSGATPIDHEECNCVFDTV